MDMTSTWDWATSVQDSVSIVADDKRDEIAHFVKF